MVLRIEALPQRRRVVDTAAIATQIDVALVRFAGSYINAMADYPEQQPTSTNYRRTGDLGRDWRITRFNRQADSRQIVVENRISYGVYVQGPRSGPIGGRQTLEMRRRRWQRFDEVARRIYRQQTRPVVLRIFSQGGRRRT